MVRHILILVVLGTIVSGGYCAVIEPRTSLFPMKVFNYQGDLPPIKDDRTGEIIQSDATNGTGSANVTSEAEKLCWDLIVEQSGK